MVEAFDTPASWVELIGALVIGYALGSIPFGVVLTRLTGGPDLRSVGSGNIGATNVLRTGKSGPRRRDASRRYAERYARRRGRRAFRRIAGARRGKRSFWGISFRSGSASRAARASPTFLGCLIGFYWPAALIFAVAWLGDRLSGTSSSLAALWASVAGVIALLAFGLLRAGLVFGLLTVILWAKHAPNIKRLLAGSEGA